MCLRMKSAIGDVYTQFQVDAFKKLILLCNLLHANFQQVVIHKLKSHSQLFLIKQFDHYQAFKFLIKENNFVELKKFENDNKVKFSVDKNLGLLQLVIERVLLNKILDVFKFYNKIRISKLVSRLEIPIDILLTHLRKFAYVRKEIN